MNEIEEPTIETQPGKLVLKRIRWLIFIRKHDDASKLRYNLKDKCIEKYYVREREWRTTKNQYSFFRGYTMHDVETDEPKLKRLLELTAKYNDSCSSIATFFDRMNDLLVYENYLDEGLRVEDPSSWRGKLLTKPVKFYTKKMIRVFKDYDILITKQLEDWVENNWNLAEKAFNNINAMELLPNDKVDFVDRLVNSNYNFERLINDYNYDFKTLVEYLYGYLKPFENIDFYEGVRTLYDYYRMASRIGRNVKKYPKYLHSMHDIITANYNAYKEEYDEELFKKLRKTDLDFKGKEFSIVTPESPKEIVAEGTDLNHCVGSYVSRILEGSTYIFFLRKTEEPEKSLVTLELKDGKIQQAKGSYNRRITPEEREFLEDYLKKKKLKLGEYL